MHHHQLSARDYEGYGVYEHNQPRHLQSMGALPSLAALQQVETINGLAHVPNAIKPAAIAALDVLRFDPVDDIELLGVSGVASFDPMSLSHPWVEGLANLPPGNVVMVQRSSVASGNVNVLATSAPLTVVMFAGLPDSDYVIVAADPAALAAAESAASGNPNVPGTIPGTTPGWPGFPMPGLPGGMPGLPTPQPSSACPPGSLNVGGQCFQTAPCPAGTDEILGVCFPRLGGGSTPFPSVPPGMPTTPPGIPTMPPGGDEPVTPVEPKKAGLPSWLLPAAVGGGIAALVFYLAKK